MPNELDDFFKTPGAGPQIKHPPTGNELTQAAMAIEARGDGGKWQRRVEGKSKSTFVIKLWDLEQAVKPPSESDDVLANAEILGEVGEQVIYSTFLWIYLSTTRELERLSRQEDFRLAASKAFMEQHKDKSNLIGDTVWGLATNSGGRPFEETTRDYFFDRSNGRAQQFGLPGLLGTKVLSVPFTWSELEKFFPHMVAVASHVKKLFFEQTVWMQVNQKVGNEKRKVKLVHPFDIVYLDDRDHDNPDDGVHVIELSLGRRDPENNPVHAVEGAVAQLAAARITPGIFCQNISLSKRGTHRGEAEFWAFGNSKPLAILLDQDVLDRVRALMVSDKALYPQSRVRYKADSVV